MKKNENTRTDTQLNYTILIVEDVLSWQKTFKRFLQNEPFIISVASNYQEALNLTETQSFDLIILDVHLSEMPDNIDGLHIGKKLWLENDQVKIIIVTGTGDPSSHLSSSGFVPIYVLKKHLLKQDDFIEKIYDALAQE